MLNLQQQSALDAGTAMASIAASVDAQQHASSGTGPKFMFNVDGSFAPIQPTSDLSAGVGAGKPPTQSLQLLFQLPTAAAGQSSGMQVAAAPPAAATVPTASIISAQHPSQTQVVQAQTQTCHQQQQQQQKTTTTMQPLRQNHVQVEQHCTQHQTTQTAILPTIAPRYVENKAVSSSGSVGKVTAKKAEKRLKDKRFPTRPTPTGQSGFQFDQAGAAGGAIAVPPFAQSATAGTPPNPALPQGAVAGAAPAAVVPEKIIDVDSKTDSNHDTALTLACAGGHDDLVELLLQRGANIEHRDKKGFTPLILASTAGHSKVVEILLHEKGDIEAQSERTKDTPLSLACSGGRYEVSFL